MEIPEGSAGALALVSFLAGAASGAVSAVAVFRATVAVLQTQVGTLIAQLAKVEQELEAVKRDMTGIANLARDVAAKVAAALPHNNGV